MMNKDLLEQEDSGTTEKVVLSEQEVIRSLITQNKETLQLLREQQEDYKRLFKDLIEARTTKRRIQNELPLLA